MKRMSSDTTHTRFLDTNKAMGLRKASLVLLSVILFTLSGYAQDTVEPSLNSEEVELTSWLDSQEENMLDMLH